MENYDIIKALRLLSALMELHDENSFKVKGLQNALFTLEKLNDPLAAMPLERLEKVDGIGKSLAAKINELVTTGGLEELTTLAAKTPRGVVEMLSIKGLGPKKVKTIWKELNIISKEELLTACNENQISRLKGFGEKTQDAIKQVLLYSQAHKDKFLYAEVEALADAIVKSIKEVCPRSLVSVSGEIRRKMETVSVIQILVGTDDVISDMSIIDQMSGLIKDPKTSGPFAWRGTESMANAKIEIKLYPKDIYWNRLYLNSCSKEHLLKEAKEGLTIGQFLNKVKVTSEEEIFNQLGMQFIVPEMREGFNEVDLARENKLPDLIKEKDLKGILHNHSTYSDGANTLEEMATYCKSMGVEYFGISDHSKTAFYANGLYENKVREQHREIDELNKKLAPFRILKGIESDILNDGSLDYEDDILATFDFVVASIHSNLKMDVNKATERLIKAIENPFTTILGHSTGRLLLKREGYPIDHKKVIDACSANGVIIEINANPRRLDMDWRWITYALEKDVMISINPDAHSTRELHNIKFGLYMGRKAGLTKEMTFNALPLEKILEHLDKKKTLSRS